MTLESDLSDRRPSVQRGTLTRMEPVLSASSESERIGMARVIAKGRLRKRGEAFTVDAIEHEMLEVLPLICVVPKRGPHSIDEPERSWSKLSADAPTQPREAAVWPVATLGNGTGIAGFAA